MASKTRGQEATIARVLEQMLLAQPHPFQPDSTAGELMVELRKRIRAAAKVLALLQQRPSL